MWQDPGNAQLQPACVHLQALTCEAVTQIKFFDIIGQGERAAEDVIEHCGQSGCHGRSVDTLRVLSHLQHEEATLCGSGTNHIWERGGGVLAVPLY